MACEIAFTPVLVDAHTLNSYYTSHDHWCWLNGAFGHAQAYSWLIWTVTLGRKAFIEIGYNEMFVNQTCNPKNWEIFLVEGLL